MKSEVIFDLFLRIFFKTPRLVTQYVIQTLFMFTIPEGFILKTTSLVYAILLFFWCVFINNHDYFLRIDLPKYLSLKSIFEALI